MVILETLEQHIDTIVTKLTSEERQQFVRLLHDIEQAEDEHSFHDALDALFFEFCLKIPFLKELLNKPDERKVPIGNDKILPGKKYEPPTTRDYDNMVILASELISTLTAEDADSKPTPASQTPAPSEKKDTRS